FPLLPIPPISPLFPTRRSSDLFAFVLSERHILAVQTLEGNLRLRSTQRDRVGMNRAIDGIPGLQPSGAIRVDCHADEHHHGSEEDRKSTRLNSSHLGISYAVCC